MAKPHPEEEKLISKILTFQDDPYSFVLFAFPWGESGSPLREKVGPRKWQTKALKQIRDHIQQNRAKGIVDDPPEIFRMARASGRGIGKSAFLAWVGLWMFCTRIGSTTIVSANTEGQLKDTTFPEIKKWASMSVMNRWFNFQAMSIKPADWLIQALKETTKLDDAYWYIQARLWSEENPDAYAGPHSQEGMAVLFDEASGIAGNIWSVAQGYFTDRTIHRVWIAISNPRNPSGEFFNCFHIARNLWNTESIDARTVEENDQSVYQGIIDRYGIDSDQARVEVYGMFPRLGDNQFIGRGLLDEACERELDWDAGAPLVMGVDPARFGDDNAEIAYRKGRDATVVPWKSFPKGSLVELAYAVAAEIDTNNPDAVFIEGDGVGGGLIDILRDRGYKVIEVSMGGRADDRDSFRDHRTEVWDRMREWVVVGKIDRHDNELHDDLAGPTYDFNEGGKLRLETKAQMKKRGLASPNKADALAVTFSKPVARHDRRSSRAYHRPQVAEGVDYTILA